MDDIEVIEEKPYKFDIILNANNESVDKNFLMLKLLFELP